VTQTFGGATGDDAWIAGDSTYGQDNGAIFKIGWFYPTTLTAGRTYFGMGTTGALPGLMVDSTNTDELRFETNNTTDGRWITTNADITTGKFWCIAVMSAMENTGPVGACRIWVGDEMTPPQEKTVSASVAPVGNFTGQSRMVVGNQGSSGTVAFQGDVAAASWIMANGAGTPPFDLDTFGVIPQDVADKFLMRIIRPWWEGTIGIDAVNLLGVNCQVVHWDGISTRAIKRSTSDVGDHSQPVTMTGLTLSARRPARLPRHDWVNLKQYVPRRVA